MKKPVITWTLADNKYTLRIDDVPLAWVVEKIDLDNSPMWFWWIFDSTNPTIFDFEHSPTMAMASAEQTLLDHARWIIQAYAPPK